MFSVSYQWTINLWTEHILELSKEAINNIAIGNFFSLGFLTVITSRHVEVVLLL